MHIKIIIAYERNAFVMRFPDLGGGGGLMWGDKETLWELNNRF